MGGTIADIVLSRLGEFVAENIGLHFPDNRRRDLDRGFAEASREFGFQDPEKCAEWLMSAPLTRRQIEILASHLTVGETYFFREKHSLDLLEKHILPELIAPRRETGRRLRIWDAGCSTGEEPYSFAILLHRLLPDLKDWNITILGTDINPRALLKASEGVYGEWSFRNASPWLKDRYFNKTGDGGYEVLPEIKKMVTFSYHNVVEDSYPSLVNNIIAMDIIICCNVLMYFTPERAGQVIQKFYRTLVEGGWLIVGPNDPVHFLPRRLEWPDFTGASVYRKRVAGLATPVVEAVSSPGASRAWQVVVPSRPEIPTPAAKKMKAEARMPLPDAPKTPSPTPYEDALSLYGQGLYADVVAKLITIQGPEALALLARAYANQGRLAEAAKCCEKVISADRLAPSYRYLLAMILQEQGDIQGAMASLKRVLYLDHEFVLAHVGLGNLALRLGMLKESKRYFANALYLLRAYPSEEVLPESEGITAGRLTEVIEFTMSEDKGYGTEAGRTK